MKLFSVKGTLLLILLAAGAVWVRLETDRLRARVADIRNEDVTVRCYNNSGYMGYVVVGMQGATAELKPMRRL